MSSSNPAAPFAVLVVDDDPDVRELLVEYFQDRGFEVDAAGDGRAAQIALQREAARYGLILTDLHLPGADGLAVLHAAKQANPSAYIVIITGYASLDTAIKAVRLGAYDYLTKPFSVGQIDVIVERLTDRLTLESENRHLTRRLGDQQGGDLTTAVLSKLNLIDSRLTRIEELMLQRGRA
jgi:two-component system, NtrC family, response regulator AtoC